MIPDQFLRTWLHENCVRMAPGALNHLCFRVVARRLYVAYTKALGPLKRELVNEEDFCRQVTEEFGVQLSDWRYVENTWEKEFDGIIAVRLTDPLPRRNIKFKSRAPKYEDAQKLFD